MTKIGALTTLFALLIPVLVHATEIHVPADYPTIHEAMDVAMTGDTITVAPGTYIYDNYTPIDYQGKDVHLRSSGGAAVTTLASDAGPTGTGVQFQNGEGPGAILEGFTISGWGTAVLINGSTPTVRDNIVTLHNGPGISITGSSPPIIGNVFEAGQAGAQGVVLTNADSEIAFNTFRNLPSGGIFTLGTSATEIHHNTFKENGWYSIELIAGQPSSADIHHNLFLRNYGTVINVEDPGAPTITDNDFIDNYHIYENILRTNTSAQTRFERNYCRGPATPFSYLEYAVYAFSPASPLLFLENNVFSRFVDTGYSHEAYVIGVNSWDYHAQNCTFQDVECAAVGQTHPTGNFYNAVVWDWAPFRPWLNVNFQYTDVGPAPYGGYMNFTADPLFVNTAEGDYHLLPGSPCIDAPTGGAPIALDLDGNVRDSLPDIGAYEYIGHDHWFRGYREKGGAMTVVFQGNPGETVILGHSPNVRPSPVPTMYGDLWLAAPMTRMNMGTIGPNGILEVNFTIPPWDLPVRFYTQALVGSVLTPLQEVTLGG